MWSLLVQKFSEENQELMDKLLETGDEELIEGNTWKDVFWGYDVNLKQGKNNLGKMLMKIRDARKTTEFFDMDFVMTGWIDFI